MANISLWRHEGVFRVVYTTHREGGGLRIEIKTIGYIVLFYIQRH